MSWESLYIFFLSSIFILSLLSHSLSFSPSLSLFPVIFHFLHFFINSLYSQPFSYSFKRIYLTVFSDSRWNEWGLCVTTTVWQPLQRQRLYDLQNANSWSRISCKCFAQTLIYLNPIYHGFILPNQVLIDFVLDDIKWSDIYWLNRCRII